MRKHARKIILCLQIGASVLFPHADNFCRTGERPLGLQMPRLLLSSWAGMPTAQVNKTAACAPVPPGCGHLGRIMAPAVAHSREWRTSGRYTLCEVKVSVYARYACLGGRVVGVSPSFV